MGYRLERKSWLTDDSNPMGIKGHGGIFDSIDNAIKGTYRITDDEYDYICEHATDEILNLVVKDNLTFTEKRKLLVYLNSFI